MRILLLPATALLLFTYPAMAGEFARYVPADTPLYMESRDVPGALERLQGSPLGESLQAFDWKGAVVFFLQLADSSRDGQNTSFDGDTLVPLLDGLASGYQTLLNHFNGDWAISISGLNEVMQVFAENQDVRAEFFLDEVLDEEVDEDDPELLAQLEREAELDATELAAMLGTFSLLADVREEASLEELLLGWMQGLTSAGGFARISSEERDGTTFHSLRTADPDTAIGLFWFIRDGVWGMAFTQNRIRDLAGFLTVPPPRALASRPDYQEAVRETAGTDSFTFVDIAALDRLLRRAADEAGDLPASGNLNAQRLMDWLSLGAVLPLTQGTRLEGNGVRTTSRLGFKRETALSRLLFDEESGPFPQPAFLHRDLAQFSVGNWHMGRFWTRLEQELMQLAPEAAAGLGMARMLATGQLGFDVKLQFFDHLDSGLLYAQEIDPEVMAELQKAMATEDPAEILRVSSEHPTSGQNYLIGLELKNEEMIRSSIDRLLTRFFPQGAPEPELIEGIEVINPVPPGLAGGMFDDFLHLAFLDGWLLIALGERSLLEQAVTASQDETLQIWRDPEFLQLRAELPQEASGLQYTSGSMQEDALEMMKSSLAMLAKDVDAEFPDFSPLAAYLDAILQTTTRNGLVVKTESFMKFRNVE